MEERKGNMERMLKKNQRNKKRKKGEDVRRKDRRRETDKETIQGDMEDDWKSGKEETK